MATPRETLKYYFRKYALPTEQQFAELIDAFVHKDEDMLTQEKIDGLTAALKSKVSAETLEQYKAEVQAMIEEASSGVSNITERLDTAEDNIAGHETRIQALESAQDGSAVITVDAELSTESENPVQNKVIASALQSKANNTDLQNLQSLVESFLNDADASEATINKWKELESFLSGITDQETLSGLLAALKEEIIALIPEPQQGNFVKQITDLDTYEGTTGEIVQYIGQTTSTRTRGFFYEKKAGEEKEVTIFYEGKDCYTDVSKNLGIENYNRLYQDYGMTDYGFCTLVDGKTLPAYSVEGVTGAFVFKDYHAIGDFYTDTYAYRITDSNLTEDDSTITIGSRTFDKSHEIQMPIWRTSNGKYIASTPRQGDYVQYWVGLTDDLKPYCFGEMNYAQDPTTDTITTDPSWQVIPVGPCVG